MQDDKKWVPSQAIHLFERGFTPTQVSQAEVLNYHGNPASERTCRRWKRYWELGVADSTIGGKEETDNFSADEVEVVYALIKDTPRTAREISEIIDRSEATVRDIIEDMLAAGYNIIDRNQRIMASTKESMLRTDNIPGAIATDNHMRLAAFADFHKGSKWEQRTSLRRFIAHARAQGVKNFFVPGDLTAGQSGYRGHEFDAYVTSPDLQIDILKEDLDIREDERWFILGGNHDFWHIKNGYTDPIYRFAADFPNVYFLGYDQADIPITDNLKVRMWHPSGGVPYSWSYRLQKGIEALSSEQMRESFFRETFGEGEVDPSVRIVYAGHLHVSLVINIGGVVAMQVGCFEGQTNYLKRKPLYPEIGGYIHELYLTDSGMISRSVTEWVAFPEIKDDYKNYPLPRQWPIDDVEKLYLITE